MAGFIFLSAVITVVVSERVVWFWTPGVVVRYGVIAMQTLVGATALVLSWRRAAPRVGASGGLGRRRADPVSA